MIYKTSLDTTAKAITFGITALFLFIIFGQYAFIKEQQAHAVPFYTDITLILIYFLTFAFRPVDYEITPEYLIIRRLFNNVKIKRDNIKNTELLSKENLSLSIRTFGVGGLFGYYGQFVNRKIGSMTWYATRKDKTVLIRTLDKKNIILSPDFPEQFMAAVLVK